MASTEVMNQSKKPPPSHFSASTASPGFRSSAIVNWSRPKLSLDTQLSPPEIVRRSRLSSVYSIDSARSLMVTVFTDDETLLSPSGQLGSAIETEELIQKPIKTQVSSTPVRPPSTTFKLFPSPPKENTHKAVNSLTPQPLKLAFKPSERNHVDDGQASDAIELTTTSKKLKPARRVTIKIDPETSQPQRPRRSFYHPKRILRFTGLFPDLPVVRTRRLVNVDKLLPQAPYHVFDKKRKSWLLVLIALAAVLSPLATIVYFPAMRSIAAVSIPIFTQFPISN